MKTYRFTIVIDGDSGTDDRINALFEAGCDDATFLLTQATVAAQLCRAVATRFSMSVLSVVDPSADCHHAGRTGQNGAEPEEATVGSDSQRIDVLLLSRWRHGFESGAGRQRRSAGHGAMPGLRAGPRIPRSGVSSGGEVVSERWS